MGAAILAGVGVGEYSSIPEACESIISITSRTEPDAERYKRYSDIYAEYTKLYPALKDRFKAITG